MPNSEPSGDAVAVCHVCGHEWRLTWIIARSLFRRTAPGSYECGPSDCPQCNPRLGALWSAARGTPAAGFPVAAPVNLPPDTERVRPARE